MSEEVKKEAEVKEEVKKSSKLREIIKYIIVLLVGAAAAAGIIKHEDIKDAVIKGEQANVQIQDAMYKVDVVITKVKESKDKDKVVEEVITEEVK